MTTRALIIASAIAFVGGAAYYDNLLAALILGVGHVLLWYLHTIEVKVNKLLSHYGIHVSKRELDE